MRYRRAIAFLRRHPELLDDAFVMPLSEAERLLQADPPPTFAEMIARAKEQHPECPPERWAAYDRILARQAAAAESAEGVAVADAAAREHGQATAGVAEGAAIVEGAPESGRPVVAAARERRSAGPRRWRPVRAAAGVVAAAALFLALVPAGRTFAHDVLHYLVGVFGNTVTIARQKPTATATAQAEAILYDDLASFTADTGLVPFVLDVDWLQIDRVYGRVTSKDTVCLSIIYLDTKGNLLYTTQEWSPEQEIWAHIDGDSFANIELQNGSLLFINKKPQYTWFDGFIELENSFLFLGASPEIDLQEIIRSLQ